MGIGGAPSRKKTKQPRLDAQGEWAKRQLYGIIEGGVAGRGLYPSGYEDISNAYAQSYQDAKPEYMSQINRLIPGGDTKVRDYMSNMLERGHQSTQLALKENETTNRFNEQTQAIGMGFEALAGERRMGVNYTNMANSSALRMASMPTFADTMGYGLVQAAMWTKLSAGERYAQGMAGGLR